MKHTRVVVVITSVTGIEVVSPMAVRAHTLITGKMQVKTTLMINNPVILDLNRIKNKLERKILSCERRALIKKVNFSTI
jgi:hypothetical protein